MKYKRHIKEVEDMVETVKKRGLVSLLNLMLHAAEEVREGHRKNPHKDEAMIELIVLLQRAKSLAWNMEL
jgi:hypothetical protein